MNTHAHTYRVDFERIGTNQDVASTLITAAGPDQLAENIRAYAQQHLPGRRLVVDLATDLSGGHLHQGIGDDLGTFTVTDTPRR